MYYLTNIVRYTDCEIIYHWSAYYPFAPCYDVKLIPDCTANDVEVNWK